MTKQYVEYFLPPVELGQEDRRVVIKTTTRDPRTLVEQAPEGCFGFRLFERQSMIAQDGEELLGEPRNHTGIQYFGGVLMSLKEASRRFLVGSAVNNFRREGVKKVVFTGDRSLKPFRLEDVVLQV
ncbi:MAG: hypothetical protein HYS32_04465 [Candidatus Woesearchaeota archaeon]|nr:MAG: hypothetical protein HYS32_04465 [Candidatus Woesearchaeota archaeon]